VWEIRRREVVALSLYSSEWEDIGWEGWNGSERRSVGRSVGWAGEMYVEYRYFSRPRVRYRNEVGAACQFH
jgi:hypothetical protein